MKELTLTFGGMMIRHGATVTGGWLLSQGYVDADAAAQVTGALIALGGVVLSAVNKTKRAF